MEMLNFNAYKHKDMQHFMQILNQCESEGITDIRFVRKQLHSYLYKPQKVRAMHTVTPKTLKTVRNKCPECAGTMYPAKGEKLGLYVTVEGHPVLVCPGCRYSEVEK